jgi:NAD(P)H-dependent flavin oxidoreductase YrpB (nitropropane dioxygenase family)
MSLASLFGVELPIVQAPMAGVQLHELALAVSNAGGLGSLPCAMLDTTVLGSELAALAGGTRHPFNVNFFVHVPPAPDAAREAAWRACARALLRRARRRRPRGSRRAGAPAVHEGKRRTCSTHSVRPS